MAKTGGSGFGCALSFFTVIPASCGEFSPNMVYWFFMPGLVIGFLSGIAYYLLYLYTDPILAASAALVLILVISGFSHLDGVLDTGDALMFRGDLEHRREILKDHFLGAGAIGWAVAIYLPTFAVLTVLNPLSGFITIVLAEMISKASFAIGLNYGKPFSQTGLFNQFRKFAVEKGAGPLAINAGIPMIASIIAGTPFLAASIISLILTIPVLFALSRAFSGLNGDLLGFVGEGTRLIYMLSATLSFLLIHATVAL